MSADSAAENPDTPVINLEVGESTRSHSLRLPLVTHCGAFLIASTLFEVDNINIEKAMATMR